MRHHGHSSTGRSTDRLLALGGSLLVHGIAVAAIVAVAGGAAEDAPAPPALIMALEWSAAPSGEPAPPSAAGGAPSDSTTTTAEASQPMSEPLVDASEPRTEIIAAMTRDDAPVVAAESAMETPQPSPPPPPQTKTAAAAKPKPVPSRRADDGNRPATAITGPATATPGDSLSAAAMTGAPAAPSPGRSASERDAWSVTSRTPPAYPMSARRRGIEGEVALRVDVDSDGRPRVVTIARSSGDRQLDGAAARAVEQWRFAVAAPMAIEIPILFRLNTSSAAATQP